MHRWRCHVEVTLKVGFRRAALIQLRVRNGKRQVLTLKLRELRFQGLQFPVFRFVQPSNVAVHPAVARVRSGRGQPLGCLSPSTHDVARRVGDGAATPTSTRGHLTRGWPRPGPARCPRAAVWCNRMLDGSGDHRRHKRPRACNPASAFSDVCHDVARVPQLRPIGSDHSMARACLVAPAPGPAALDSASVGASRLWQPSPDRSRTTALLGRRDRLDRSCGPPPSAKPERSSRLCPTTRRARAAEEPTGGIKRRTMSEPFADAPPPHHRITTGGRACAVSLRTSTNSRTGSSSVYRPASPDGALDPTRAIRVEAVLGVRVRRVLVLFAPVGGADACRCWRASWFATARLGLLVPPSHSVSS